jgi:hypothetical protein
MVRMFTLFTMLIIIMYFVKIEMLEPAVYVYCALNYLADDSARFCLLGDLNLPDFNWDFFVHPDNQLYNSFSEFASDNGLSQLVDQPTRGDNILNSVFCSDVLCCDNFSHLPQLANSDHCVVSFDLVVSFPVMSAVYEQLDNSRANFRKANWHEFRCFLASIYWIDELSGFTSTSDMWDRFIEIVNTGVTMHVPRYKRNFYMPRHAKYPSRIKMFHNKVLAPL